MSTWSERPWAHRTPFVCLYCAKYHGLRWGWPCPTSVGDAFSTQSTEEARVNGREQRITTSDSVRDPLARQLFDRRVPFAAVNWEVVQQRGYRHGYVGRDSRERQALRPFNVPICAAFAAKKSHVHSVDCFNHIPPSTP